MRIFSFFSLVSSIVLGVCFYFLVDILDPISLESAWFEWAKIFCMLMVFLCVIFFIVCIFALPMKFLFCKKCKS